MEDSVIKEILKAKRESKRIEFKEFFDTSQLKDWCEIIKDIIAMSNSGGGYIIFGLKNDGSPSERDISSIFYLDSAQISDKVSRYIGEPFSDFELVESCKLEKRIAILSIGSTLNAIVFSNPGTYPVGNGKQENAFSRGSLYFRHGAKSEPTTAKDLRDFISLSLEKTRKSWLTNVRKVIKAPLGHEIKILPKGVMQSNNPNATAIRLVEDTSAPAYHLIDPNTTHPFGLGEIVKVLESSIKDKGIAKYDLICIKKVYEREISNKNLIYKPKLGSPQYGTKFVDWILEKFTENSNFFEQTRKQYHKILYGYD